MKLVIQPAIEPERLRKIAEVVDGNVVNADSVESALVAMSDADAFFGKVTPELLAAATKLRWIQSPTASLEHYVFPELVEHPAVLTNMRGLFSDVIADHVLGFVLCFARNLHLYVRRQLERSWAPVGGEQARSGFVTGAGVMTEMDRSAIHLADATLGVIGLGAIGREVARRAAGFGMSLLAVDPRVPGPRGSEGDDLPSTLADVWLPDRLHDLLRGSDFVCIAAPHTPDTTKLIRQDELRAMRSSAYLINIGRGAIVDLVDLTAALEAGEIAGAALDVFETEPLPDDHRLWGMENVLITPHVAACSPRIAERHLEVLLENLRRFQSGRELVNVADKEKWY